MRNERGSTSGELVVLIPVLMIVVLFAVYVGRATQTVITLQHVADVAARDASMASRRNAQHIAVLSAQRELQRGETLCSRAKVESRVVQVNDLAAIKVDISCSLSMKDVLLLRVAPHSLHASAVSVIDRYRGQ